MADELISKQDKSRIDRLDAIDSAFVMLALVNQFHTEQMAVFSKELVLAICWEESFFQNIPQLQGPAVGYGQLETDGRRIANQHFTRNPSAGEGAFSAPAILTSQATSIRAISHCLAGLYERLGSKRAALDGFAGVSTRPENGSIPARWEACAIALQSALAGGPLFMIAFEFALRRAKTFDAVGPVYAHIHNRLWPLVTILEELVSQVQTGSQGPQVMIVQDAMNRIQDAVPAPPLASLPLAVDGMFGPKTSARVKQFQSTNQLTPDGIVGPNTRDALKRRAKEIAAA